MTALTWQRSAGIKVPSSLLANWFVVAVGAFVAAAAVTQIASGLPMHYTWLRPAELVLDSIRAPHFMTAVALAALCAGYHRVLFRRLAEARTLRGGAARLWLLGGIGILAGYVVAALVFPRCTFLDRSALALAAGFLLARPPSAASLRQLAIPALMLFALLIFISYGFTVFKALLFTSSSSNDALLMSVESGLFGAPPHRFFAELGRDYPGLLVLSDRVYFRFFQHMALIAVFLFMLGKPKEQIEFAVAISLAYMIGAFAHYALPAYGPVYADPGYYTHLANYPLIANLVQADFLSNSLAASSGNLDQLTSYAFLATVPSLHMSHEIIMLYYARHSIAFFLGCLVFLLVTGVATMMLGWHYLIDFLPSIPLAIVAILLARCGASAMWRWSQPRAAAASAD